MALLRCFSRWRFSIAVARFVLACCRSGWILDSCVLCTTKDIGSLLSNRASKLMGGNEGHVQGLGLALQMFEAARGAGGSGLKRFAFIVGLPAHDQGQMSAPV